MHIYFLTLTWGRYPFISIVLLIFVIAIEVIRLVGEHMSGKVTLSPLVLDKPHIPLEVGGIND